MVDPFAGGDGATDRDKLTRVGTTSTGVTLFEDQFGGSFMKSRFDTSPQPVAQVTASALREMIEREGRSTSGTAAVTGNALLGAQVDREQLAQRASEFDVDREDRLAREEIEDARYIQELAVLQAERDQDRQLTIDKFNSELRLEQQRMAREDAAAATNMRFLLAKEERAAAADNRSARLAAQAQIATIQDRQARINLERTSLQQQAQQFNATAQAADARFNSQMELTIDNENQRRREANRAELRATAIDIAEFSKNPGDVAKISAFLRAGGGGALTEAAQRGEVGFTDESLAPLRGLLGVQQDLLQGPELATFDPIESERTAIPEFDAQGRVPGLNELFQPVGFSGAGVQQGAPSGDVSDLLLQQRQTRDSPPLVNTRAEPGPAPTATPTAAPAVAPAVAPGAAPPPVSLFAPDPTVIEPADSFRAGGGVFDPRTDPDAQGDTTEQPPPVLQLEAGPSRPIFDPVRDADDEAVDTGAIGINRADTPQWVIDGVLAGDISPTSPLVTGEFSGTFDEERDGGTTDADVIRVGEAVKGKPNPELIFQNPDGTMTIVPERKIKGNIFGAAEIAGAQEGGVFERQPLGLASAAEADAFMRQVVEDAKRRIGITKLFEAAPIKVSAPGTPRFLQQGAQAVLGAAGLFNEETFDERLQQVRPTGVRAGVTRRTQ